MPITRISRITRSRARLLRNEATRPEQVLWQSLKDLKKLGLHFRRQAPIESFIADFVCFKENLIIEVDGFTHSSAAELDYDQRRQRFLENEGHRVIRCTNDDVLSNDEGVIMEILIATGKAK